ncbi:hypothetical protein JM82_0290 [Olleya sp. Hel_I_94]|nr:hypothetical protein JM82_0290 [Olleya sp. Hel_I_94]
MTLLDDAFFSNCAQQLNKLPREFIPVIYTYKSNGFFIKLKVFVAT